MCVSAGLIQTRSSLPDFTLETAADEVRVADRVIVLCHLVRLMCGVCYNANCLGGNDQFFRFVVALHDIIYAWNDGGVASASMLACIKRSRANIVAYTRALIADQISLAPDLTRAVLELAEAKLYRHLDCLTMRRVRMTRRAETTTDDHQTRASEGLPGSSAAAATISEVRALQEEGALLRPGDSEWSIYTMTSSYMSPPRRCMVAGGPTMSAAAASPKRFDTLLSGGFSTERMSLLSGASSVYATTASLSNDGDSTVSASRLSHGLPRCSLPHAAAPARSSGFSAAALVHAHGTSDADDYFETPDYFYNLYERWRGAEHGVKRHLPYSLCMENGGLQYVIEHGVERHLPYVVWSVTCHMLCVCHKSVPFYRKFTSSLPSFATNRPQNVHFYRKVCIFLSKVYSMFF